MGWESREERSASGSDPFGLTPNPAAYVPREASERALAQLLEAVERGDRPAVLIGPPGLGKTLLLHVLARRVGHELHVAYVPNPALDPEGLCRWVLAALGSPAVSEPVTTLEGLLDGLRERDSALLLLVDDVGTLPIETASWLSELCARSRGALRVAIAALEDSEPDREVLLALGPVRPVPMDAPMSAHESEAYVAGRLRAAGAPEALRERFDRATIGRLHRLAGGNPRELHWAAIALLRGRDPSVGLDRADPSGAAADRSPGSPGTRADGIPPRALPPAPPRRSGPTRVPSGLAVFATALLAGSAVVAIPLLRGFVTPTSPPEATASEEPAEPRTPKPSAPAPAEPAPPAPAPPAAQTAIAPGGPYAVQVTASPGTEIEIDGVYLGESPLPDIPLRRGDHLFRARTPDGRLIERTIHIDASIRAVLLD